MGTDADRTKPAEATLAEDRQEAQSDHDADRPPTRDEAQSAERHSLDSGTAAAHRQANERGAAAEGEGRIES